MKKNIKKSVLALGAAPLFVGGSLVVSPAIAMAQGAEEEGETEVAVPEGSLSLIDPAQDGKASIIVHKYEGEPTDVPNNGTDVSDQLGDLTPLSDVTFKLSPVLHNGEPIDLKTEAGWNLAQGINLDNLIAGTGDYSLGETTSKVTSEGKATFENLKLSMYFVEEVPKAGYSTVKPFLIAAPLTDPDNHNAWMYNVHAFPKNQPITVTKSVKDAGKNSGDKISYTVDGDMPTPDKTAEGAAVPFKNYSIGDRLEADKVDAEGATVTVTADGADITEDDYTLFKSEGHLRVSFKESGLAKLATARLADSTAQVHLKIDVTIKNVKYGDPDNGVIRNTAYIITPNPKWQGTPGTDDNPDNPDQPNEETPSNEVETKEMGVLITKKGTDDVQGEKMNGAEFELHKCKVGEQSLIDGESLVTVNGKTKVTTSTDGSGSNVEEGSNFVEQSGVDVSGQSYAAIASFQRPDFQDGKSVDKTFDYCLVETKAPDGYELQPKPILIDSTSNTGVASITVNDVPSNGKHRLALTGGQRATMIAIAGAMLLVGFGLVWKYKKNDAVA